MAIHGPLPSPSTPPLWNGIRPSKPWTWLGVAFHRISGLDLFRRRDRDRPDGGRGIDNSNHSIFRFDGHGKGLARDGIVERSDGPKGRHRPTATHDALIPHLHHIKEKHGDKLLVATMGKGAAWTTSFGNLSLCFSSHDVSPVHR